VDPAAQLSPRKSHLVVPAQQQSLRVQHQSLSKINSNNMRTSLVVFLALSLIVVRFLSRAGYFGPHPSPAVLARGDQCVLYKDSKKLTKGEFFFS